MKIILVATGAKGKNVVFVSDALKVFALGETVRLAKDGNIENVYAVDGRSGAYVRTKPHTNKAERLEQLSVSPHQLFASANDASFAMSTPALARYLKLYERALEEESGPYIVIGGHRKITKDAAKAKLTSHKGYIFEAAEKFNVDPYLLGAILIDEIARFLPFEGVGEALLVFFVGKNASGGIAQVKVETARGLIQDGYYNPDPGDQMLSVERIKKTSRAHLYQYVKEPKYSIFFAAARIRELIDRWKVATDIHERPNIIATLYSFTDSKHTPHANPQPSNRGLQIASEFYELAKEWLQ